MDRAEATGFGVAAAGHLALFAILSLGLANAVTPPLRNQPIEVSFVAEAAPDSAAPAPSQEAPAPRLAQEAGPPEPAPAEPSAPPPAPTPVPQPIVTAAPAPRPAPQPRTISPAPARAPTAKPAPPKRPTTDFTERRRPERPNSRVPRIDPTPPPRAAAAAAPARSRGNLKGILDGIDTEADGKAATPSARVASAAVQSSLRAEVLRQLRPHWKAPTGADAEQLRTELSITLAPNGAVTNVEVIRTTGQTASNRPQVRLHQEQAIRAARLASPLKLPREYYDAWKLLSPIGFDKRLSQ